MYSAARYLAAAGGAGRSPPRRCSPTTTPTGTSTTCSSSRTSSAQGGGEATLTYDTLQQDLGGAQLAIVQASEALTRALKEGKRASARSRRICSPTSTVSSSSPQRLAAQKRATLAGVEHAAIRSRDRRAPRRARGGGAGARRRTRAARRARASRRRRRRCSARRPTRATTSFRSAAARASSPSAPPTTTTRRPTSPRPQGSPLYALADGDRHEGLALRLALRDRLHDPDDRRADLDVLPPRLPRAGSRAPVRCSRRARPSGSSARPATRPARTSTSSSSRRRCTRRRWPGSSRSPAGRSGGRATRRRLPREQSLVRGTSSPSPARPGPENDVVFFNR